MPTSVIEFENEHLLIINKPPDIRIDGDDDVTADKIAEDLIAEQCTEEYKFACDSSPKKRKKTESSDYLSRCHQLDYATSGLLIYAKSKPVASAVSKLFSDRRIVKTYLALVFGHVGSKHDSVLLDWPLTDDKTDPESFRQKTGTKEDPGKSCITEIEVLSRGRLKYSESEVNVSKVRLHLRTGRRHQLRVHLKAYGHPIVGDATYASDKMSPRMMLHAHELFLPLPGDLSGVVHVVSTDPYEKFYRSTSPEDRPGSSILNSFRTYPIFPPYPSIDLEYSKPGTVSDGTVETSTENKESLEPDSLIEQASRDHTMEIVSPSSPDFSRFRASIAVYRTRADSKQILVFKGAGQSRWSALIAKTKRIS